MHRMLLQFTLIISSLAFGNVIVSFFRLPLSGSIVGMLLLFFSLLTGIIQIEWVEKAANAHLQHMTLLFIPAVIGALVYLHTIHMNIWKLGVVIAGSSLCILIITGYSVELYEKIKRRIKS
jgi:holin-like protein